MRLVRHLAAALLLAAPGSALAQDVPFHTLARSHVGPFGDPANRVIRSAQELRQAGLAKLVDPAALAAIDWQREMVVACQLGTCSSGGYAIEIQSMREEAGTLQVEYQVRRPAPGAFVPDVITSPFHLARVRRFAQVEFRSPSAAASLVFQRVSLEYEAGPIGGAPGSVRVEVDSSGAATRSSSASPTPVRGQASPAQLAALRSAIEQAQASSLPAAIPPGVMFVTAPPGFSLEVVSGRPQLAGRTRGALGHYGKHAARVKPLVDALRAIGDGLQDGGAPWPQPVPPPPALPSAGIVDAIPGE